MGTQAFIYTSGASVAHDSVSDLTEGDDSLPLLHGPPARVERALLPLQSCGRSTCARYPTRKEDVRGLPKWLLYAADGGDRGVGGLALKLRQENVEDEQQVGHQLKLHDEDLSDRQGKIGPGV